MKKMISKAFALPILAMALMFGGQVATASASCVAWQSGLTAGQPHLHGNVSTASSVTEDQFYVGANCTGTASTHKYHIFYQWQEYNGTAWVNSNAPGFDLPTTLFGVVGDTWDYTPDAFGGISGTSPYQTATFQDNTGVRLYRGTELDGFTGGNNAPGIDINTINCGGATTKSNGFGMWPYDPTVTDTALLVRLTDETTGTSTTARTPSTHLNLAGKILPDCFAVSTTPAGSSFLYP